MPIVGGFKPLLYLTFGVRVLRMLLNQIVMITGSNSWAADGRTERDDARGKLHVSKLPEEGQAEIPPRRLLCGGQGDSRVKLGSSRRNLLK